MYIFIENSNQSLDTLPLTDYRPLDWTLTFKEVHLNTLQRHIGKKKNISYECLKYRLNGLFFNRII